MSGLPEKSEAVVKKFRITRTKWTQKLYGHMNESSNMKERDGRDWTEKGSLSETTPTEKRCYVSPI